jgi:5'(3')-deoxyribonucleotidase
MSLESKRPIEPVLPVVGCDLDDVLADFMGHFIDMAHRRFGIPTDLTIRPVDWAWSNMGWTKEHQEALWQELHDTHNFWTGLKVLPKVDRGLVWELNNRSLLYFPTARAHAVGSMSTRDQCANWIQDQFQIAYPTVIVSNEKGPLAAVLKYDYFIDDRPKNCYEVKAARPECRVYMVDSSHNQDLATTMENETRGIRRVSGFNEFAQIVLEG